MQDGFDLYGAMLCIVCAELHTLRMYNNPLMFKKEKMCVCVECARNTELYAVRFSLRIYVVAKNAFVLFHKAARTDFRVYYFIAKINQF